MRESKFSAFNIDLKIVIIYDMNFSLCVLLVYNDNGSVQNTLHNARLAFYIFTLFSCVWILFYQSLS